MINNNHIERQSLISILTGLVLDRRAKHYKKMKNSIWLFLYLLLQADRTSRTVSKKVGSICSDMGQQKGTVIRWLNVLRMQGYVATRNTGRDLLIRIRGYKQLTSDMSNNVYQKKDISNFCSSINKNSEEAFRKKNDLNFQKKTKTPIDISINNNLLKIDIDKKNTSNSSFRKKQLKERKELLAYDIAQELDDFKGLAFYLSCTKKYSEQFLWEVLGQVREIPSAKIKKSRAALFNHLIQKYAQRNTQYLSH